MVFYHTKIRINAQALRMSGTENNNFGLLIGPQNISNSRVQHWDSFLLRIILDSHTGAVYHNLDSTYA